MEQCKNCNTAYNSDTIFCKVCKYPVQGSEQARASFIAKQVIQKSDVESSIELLKRSRIILFVLGAFYILVPFTPFMSTSSAISSIVSWFLGLMFIGFAFLTFKKPVIALGVPLILTILYYLLLFLLNPLYLFSGILWKAIILLGLGYGFISVRKSNKILRENPYLASLLGFGEITNK